METSKERILKAINHVQPDTTPVRFTGFEDIERWLQHFHVENAYDLMEKLGVDTCSVPLTPTGPNVERGLSIWGTPAITGGYKGIGYSKERGAHPLLNAKSVGDIERFAWPNPDDFDYRITDQIRQMVVDRACTVGLMFVSAQSSSTSQEAAWIPLICNLYELFGFEETLIRLHTDPKVIEAAIFHLETFILEVSRRLLEASKGLADIFWFGDDFATARGMMISPEHWRKFLKPTYRKIFDLAKSYGVKVWFHCCATFRPVLPDLIDIGMDVWEPLQAHLPGNEPEVLKKEYGKDIAFYGGINSQHTLPYGTPNDVRAEVRERVRVLGKGGGYICGPDHFVLPDVPIENVLALIDEARKFSPQ